MKVLLDVEFSVLEGSMPPEIAQKWETMTINNAELADKRRRARIKGATEYQEIIAEGSSQSFSDYVNPNFTIKAGLNKQEIITKHFRNMVDGWQKYEDKLNYFFETVDDEPAKRYKEMVRLAASHYGQNVAKKLLAFTGTRFGGRGCAVLATKWLDGQGKTHGSTNITVKKGGALIIARPGLRTPFRGTLVPRLVQAGASIVRSEYDEAIIKKQNDTTNVLMNAMSNPALNLVSFESGGDSHVDFALLEHGGGIHLSVRVCQK